MKRSEELRFDALGHLIGETDSFYKVLFPWLVDKAALELRYKNLYRPDRLYIPIEGLHNLFSSI